MATYCLQPTTAFFTDRSNHLAKFLQSAEGTDKTVKFVAEGIFPVVTEIARTANASERTMGNLGTGYEIVKTTRDITGMLNVFRGVIPSMYKGAVLIGKLVRGILSGNDVPLEEPKECRIYNPQSMVASHANGNQNVAWLSAQPHNPLPAHYKLTVTAHLAHNKEAVGRGEMLLQLGANIASLVSGGSFAAAFGFSRPVANVRKHFDVDYGPVANRIANLFPHIMFVNHVATVVKSSFELGYQFKARKRAEQNGNHDLARVESDFHSSVVKAAMSAIEKSLELVNDALMLTGKAAPTAVKIPLGVAISTLGLVRAWKDTV